jgi:hypothetical protein
MSTHIRDCIDANLVLLAERLSEAFITARDAQEAMDDGDRNRAIGTLLPLDEELRIAVALLQTIFTLHRLPESRTGGAR